MTSFFSTTPDPSFQKEGTTLGVGHSEAELSSLLCPLLPFIPFYTLFLLLRHALEILLDVGIGELIVLQIAVEELLVGGHVDEAVT